MSPRRSRKDDRESGFAVTFKHPDISKRHPFTGNGSKLVSAGLGTSVELEAGAYCRDLDRLCSTPDDWQDVKRCLAKYERVAVAVFFGRGHPDLAGLPDRPALEPRDVGTLLARILEAINLADSLGYPRADALKMILETYESEKFREVQTERDHALRDLREAKAEITDIGDDLTRVKRLKNLHVKEGRLDKVWNAFQIADACTALAPKTRCEIKRAVETFFLSLPGGDRFPLGDIRAGHIGAWLDTLKAKPRKEDKVLRELSQVTKAKMKRYLSVFLGWAYRKYDLVENPMDKTEAVKGAAIAREEIVAIDRAADFKEMLEALKEVDAYWHALVSTAVLAGPRYAELCWLKLEHVNLEGNFLRISTRRDGETVKGTRTGKERRVPIESTTLRTAIAEHLKRRLAQQRKKGATAAEASPWLFPSTVEENPYKPRTLTPAGLWSDNGVFGRAWAAVANKCEIRTELRPYWKYGPREWRRCAGTAMGQAGNDALRISAWLGNTEDVCRRHYVKASASGKLWPYKWD